MAVNRWKKYVVGFSSVALIGGAVGLAQKIDNINNPVVMNTTTEPTATQQAPGQDPLQQEFEQVDPQAQGGDQVVRPMPTANGTQVRPKTNLSNRTNDGSVTLPAPPPRGDDDEYAWDEDDDDHFEHHHHHEFNGEKGDWGGEEGSGQMRSQAS